KEGLININNPKKEFVFCEMDKQDYRFLEDIYLLKGLNSNGRGFQGNLAEIAIDSSQPDYGSFWSCFPFDVINLDYYGDIFKTDHQKIGITDFSTIQSVISHQSKLRRQYELWITMRAKPNRIQIGRAHV